MPLTEHAPAKINLGLHVLRRRPDGYHDIETVLHRLDWADTITAEPAESLSMTCSDPALPTDERNLCLQAARRLADRFDVKEGVALHLEKHVPYGAGLGGGSSDAAATLRLLVRLWDLDPTLQQLHEIAGEIGADVPFFLYDEPAVYATGHGEKVTPLYLEAAPYRLPFPVLVAVPPIEISTPWAYQQVTPNEANRPDLRQLVCSNEIARWRSQLTNDFEVPIAEAHPEVDDLRAQLAAEEDAYVSLSGSGGAVYGVFSTREAARRAQAQLQEGPVQTHLMEAAEAV